MNEFIKNARLEFQYSTIFELSLRDCFNPCFLSGFLIFFLYVTSKKLTVRQVFLMGIIFFYGIMISNGLLINGYYDRVLNHPAVLLSIRVFYFIIAAWFLMIALGHFREWWFLKKEKKISPLISSLPVIFLNEPETRASAESDKQKRIFNFYFARKIFCVFALGNLLIFLGSTIANDYQLYLYLTKLMMDNVISTGEAKLSVLLYNSVIILPGLFSWLLILWFMKKNRNLRTFSFVSYYKIIISAVFMATSVGLIISFI